MTKQACKRNAENRPVKFISEDGSTVVENAYDYMGRRATKKVTVNDEVTSHLRFIYRGYLQVAAINVLNGHHLWLMLWDPSESEATRPLAIRKDGTWYCYGWDLTKNICEMFGQHGYIRASYDYAPFGEVSEAGDVTQYFQWSSEYADTELGLVYYNFRHYNPTDGRWINRDPIGEEGGWNLYVMCGNNCIMYMDYMGLDVEDDTSSGFSGSFKCERDFIRQEINPQNKLLEKIGIFDLKIRVILQNKRCKGCCKKDGKEGSSKSLSFQVEGETGSPRYDILNLAEIRFGWYGRLGSTGGISASYNSCSNTYSGGGCVSAHAELGLIGSVSTRIKSLEAGARGGVNLRVSLCLTTNMENFQVKGRACVSLRVRVWAGGRIWPLGNISYHHEWQDQYCSPWAQLL